MIFQVIEKRFGDVLKFNFDNKEFILSALTIPAIKADFIEKDCDFNFAKQLLIDECKMLKSSEANVATEDDIENDGPSTSSFFVSFASRRLNRSNSTDNVIETEVNKYLNDPDVDYRLLDQYPSIREIFFRQNTTLSSSGAVERLFSQSMMIFTPRRNRLSADNFEKTLLLKHNRKLIEK